MVNAYLITFGGLLLLAGRLGDLIGRKRVFMAGLSCSRSRRCSAACPRARTLLIAARFVRGSGGALTSAVILGMVVTDVPRATRAGEGDRRLQLRRVRRRRRSGCSLGGVVTQAINWHWIFFINLPIGVVTGAAGGRALVEGDGEVRGLRRGS